MTLLSRMAAAIVFGFEMLGLLIIGLIFIIAPELALNLGLGMFRLKYVFEG